MRTQALLRVPLPLCPANLALQRSNLTMLSHLSAFPSRVLLLSLASVSSCPGCGGRDQKPQPSVEELLVLADGEVDRNESRVTKRSD